MTEPREETGRTERTRPAVSVQNADGLLAEMIYRPTERRTSFMVFRGGDVSEAPHIEADGVRLVPYAPRNNLVANGIVLFPSGVVEYGSESELVDDVRRFIHRYVDLSPLYEKVAAYYVIFSWVYDGFNELPYLRVRGDYGSGKTRFLLIVGSVCYKPIFASGASTVSPIFRLLDTFRGTLIVDEADFRLSDERAEVVKILNNGNARGFPVLRSDVTRKGEFDPHAYAVFGPKLVATRGFFEDRALESRFLTEEMGQRRLRDDIPINLPPMCSAEATELRNKLLLFRFRNLGKRMPTEALVDRTIEPRLNQVFVPLMAIIQDDIARSELQALARQYQREVVSDRGLDVEAQILEVMNELLLAADTPRLTIKEITALFSERYGTEYERITNRWVSGILRKRLGLRPQKSNGTYVIPLEDTPRLNRLREKYGMREPPAATPDDEPVL